MSYRMPVSCDDDRLDLVICCDSTKVNFNVFNSYSHTLNLAEVYIVVPAFVKPGGADVLESGRLPRRSAREIHPLKAHDAGMAAHHQSAVTDDPYPFVSPNGNAVPFNIVANFIVFRSGPAILQLSPSARDQWHSHLDLNTKGCLVSTLEILRNDELRHKRPRS